MWTTKDIIGLLKHHYRDSRQWAFFEELRIGTGYRKWVGGSYSAKNPEQRIDAWIINCYESNNFERIAFEIKISRSDFLHELKNPQKRSQAMGLSNLFYFIAPKGIIKKEEIPEDCGLIEILASGRFKWTKKAPWRDTEPLDWSFLASLSRRISKEEQML